ncbi:MAG: hypothetical protein KC944_21855 [Candidatus Omnitrophica bacterium]|nr:hypothetical protein [Candidatus Omnitrophota bacterium]
MTLDEILDTLHDLPRAEKVRAFHFLSTELAREEGKGFEDGGEFPVWSPFDSYDAAQTLTRHLKENSKG